MKQYNVRTLINGNKIGKEGEYIAVPDKFDGSPVACLWKGELMVINDWKKEAVTFRTFADKFNRNKNYTLGYFKWQPKQEL